MTAPFLGSASEVTRQRLRTSRYKRVTRDVYVLVDRELDVRARADAARLVFPDGVPCLVTAGLLLNLPVDDDARTHLARGATAARSERREIKIHRLALRDDEVLEVKGIPVTDGPRTLTDLAAQLDLQALVAVGDVVLRRWGPEAVAEAVDRCRRRRGAVLLRQAATLLDGGSDSPAETRMRLRLHAAGFTALRHKVVVRDLAGGWLAAPDLADEEAKVALQHEGAIHFERGERQRRKDIDRDEVTRSEGWQVVVSTALDDAQPHRLVRRVTSAYFRAAKLWGVHVLPPHLR